MVFLNQLPSPLEPCFPFKLALSKIKAKMIKSNIYSKDSVVWGHVSIVLRLIQYFGYRPKNELVVNYLVQGTDDMKHKSNYNQGQ